MVVATHYKKEDDLLNCGTSSSDISGYHADFHEGHGPIEAWQGAAWQGHGMGTVWARHEHCMGTAWVRHGYSMGTAWARHAMCESAFS